MSTLEFIEKRKVSQLLNKGGYVLDFTNKTYQQFILEKTRIDLYSKYGQSKGKNLEAIIINENDILVGKLLLELLKYMQQDIDWVNDNNRKLFNECIQIGNKLIGRKTKITEPQSKTQKTSFDSPKYLDELKSLSNSTDTPQARGYAFEKFLNELFKANKFESRGPFKIAGEQIDGSFVLKNDIYLLEAKWTSKPIDKADLIIFNNKVTSKSGFTRGLFISYSGYTEGAINTLSNGTVVNIILMTVQELAVSLERNISLNDLLWEKVRALAEEGRYYKDIMKL
ncbi:MAG: restriction endonuclease [Fibrobacter sp.]|jgi:hypothetical protein|nr:restriction endonuclease [Fibrobacter sp.]